MSDDEYELNSDESEGDDEETIDQAEKEEVESRADELLALEAEKDMPIEKLLAKYSGSPNSHLVDNEDMEEEEERGEDIGDSEGSFYIFLYTSTFSVTKDCICVLRSIRCIGFRS